MRTRAAAMTTLGLLLAQVAVPAQAEFKCPERGGPAWREVRTRHVVVLTDLDSANAHRLASDVERLYDLVRGGLFKQPPETSGPIRVVALRSSEEFSLFAPRGAAAFYRRSLLDAPTIVLPGTLGDDQRSVLAHELTHDLAARVYARQPWWFQEGLASYMQTVAPEGSRDGAAIGGVPRDLLRRLTPYPGGIGLVMAPRPGAQGARGYALAWALVHFLSNVKPGQFAEFQARLVRGQDPRVAWGEIFPNWDPGKAGGAETLDGELERYLQRGRFAYRPVRLPPEGPVVERPLSASDAHTIRLSLLPWSNGGQPVKPAVIEAEVEESLQHDPAHVMALTVRARSDGMPQVQDAERAVAAHPEDPRAWMLRALLTTDDPQATIGALERVTALDPQNAFAQNVLAAYLLNDGRTEQALDAARAAALQAPWEAGYLLTLSRVLEKLGRCPEALEAQERVAERDTDDAIGGAIGGADKRLEMLKSKCVTGFKP